VLIYWVIFIVLAAGALLNHRQEPGFRWAFILLAAIPTVLLIGLRWQIGPDWGPYLEIFGYTKFYSLSRSVTHSDPGFFLLLWCLHQLGAPFWVENFICGLVFVAGLTAFCSRQPNPWLAYLVSFPYLVIAVGMSLNRQSVALGFLFFALNAFERHRVLRFMLLTLAAALFHASAILMLPVGLLSFARNGLQRAILLIIASGIAFKSLDYTVSLYAARYGALRFQSSGVWYRLAMNTLPSFIFLGFQRRFSLIEHDRILWRNVSFISISMILIIFLIPSSTAIDRILLYLFPLQFVVFGRLPYILDPERKPARWIILAVIAYAFSIQMVFLNFGKFSEYFVPYKTIFY